MDESKKKEVETTIFSLLVTAKDGMDIKSLRSKYEAVAYERLPSGYMNINDIASKMRNKVEVYTNRGIEFMKAKWSDSTAHIQKMVSQQKASKKSRRGSFVRSIPARQPSSRRGGHGFSDRRSSSINHSSTIRSGATYSRSSASANRFSRKDNANKQGNTHWSRSPNTKAGFTHNREQSNSINSEEQQTNEETENNYFNPAEMFVTNPDPFGNRENEPNNHSSPAKAQPVDKENEASSQAETSYIKLLAELCEKMQKNKPYFNRSVSATNIIDGYAYNSRVFIGDDYWTNHPELAKSRQEADEIAAKKAYYALIERSVGDEVFDETSKVTLIDRLVSMVEGELYGLKDHAIPEMYKRQFSEDIAKNWLDIVKEYPERLAVEVHNASNKPSICICIPYAPKPGHFAKLLHEVDLVKKMNDGKIPRISVLSPDAPEFHHSYNRKVLSQVQENNDQSPRDLCSTSQKTGVDYSTVQSPLRPTRSIDNSEEDDLVVSNASLAKEAGKTEEKSTKQTSAFLDDSSSGDDWQKCNKTNKSLTTQQEISALSSVSDSMQAKLRIGSTDSQQSLKPLAQRDLSIESYTDGYLSENVEDDNEPFQAYVFAPVTINNFTIVPVDEREKGSPFYNMLSEMQTLYENHNAQLSCTSLQKGKLLAYKDESGVWKRCRIQCILDDDIDGQQAFVHLIDDGDNIFVSINGRRLQPLYSQFSNLPPQAVMATLHKIVSTDDTMSAKTFVALVKNKIFACYVHETLEHNGLPVLSVTLRDSDNRDIAEKLISTMCAARVK